MLYLKLLIYLPQIFGMLKIFDKWVNKVSGADAAGFMKKAAPVFQTLALAQTQEEHQNAAKNLADLIYSLPVK